MGANMVGILIPVFASLLDVCCICQHNTELGGVGGGGKEKKNTYPSH